jgi:hypothetical protein
LRAIPGRAGSPRGAPSECASYVNQAPLDGAAAARAAPDTVCAGYGLVAAYRQAGVTLPAVRPIGFPDAPHYRPTLEALASHPNRLPETKGAGSGR